MEIGRRAIIVLHLILEHNRAQSKKAESVPNEMIASVVVNPTIGVIFATGGTGLWNEFMRKYPGIDAKITDPLQIRREINKLEAAGLMERGGDSNIDKRVLRPTHAGIALMNSIYQKYGKTRPYSWPDKIQVNGGKPNWSTAIESLPMAR